MTTDTNNPTLEIYPAFWRPYPNDNGVDAGHMGESQWLREDPMLKWADGQDCLPFFTLSSLYDAANRHIETRNGSRYGRIQQVSRHETIMAANDFAAKVSHAMRVRRAFGRDPFMGINPMDIVAVFKQAHNENNRRATHDVYGNRIS